MSNIKSINVVKDVYTHLTNKRKVQLILLLGLMIISSLIEAISISSILPFLKALTDPTEFEKYLFLQKLFEFLNLNQNIDIQLLFGFIFIGLIIFSGIFRSVFFIFQTKLSASIGVDFAAKAFSNTLKQPYENLLTKNSSEILAGAQKAKDLVGWVVHPVLTLISSVCLLTTILIGIIIIEPLVAILGIIIFPLLYLTTLIITKKIIKKNSEIYSIEMGLSNKAIQESIGGIKEIIIDNKQDIYAKIYSDSLKNMQGANASNTIISNLPKFIIEVIGMSLLVFISLYFSKKNNEITTLIPTLGLIALAIQRLLPVLQQAYSSYSSIRSGIDSSIDALHMMYDKNTKIIKPYSNNISFKNEIIIKNVKYNYQFASNKILKGISFRIKKGCKLGIIGNSGSGKSTLLDVIMGLLTPTEGFVSVDNVILQKNNFREWQSKISHVPQSIFIFDSPIVENIAIGLNKDAINWDKLLYSAKIAEIHDYIDSLPNGYQTIVGERGVNLSGGQRQRIGIARAIYKGGDLLILDEASNALDVETEDKIINNLNNLVNNITVIIVSHRIDSFKNCDLIIKMNNGVLEWSGKYTELIDCKINL